MRESTVFPGQSVPSRAEWLMLVLFAGGCLVLGNLSALTMGDSQQSWYPGLTRWPLTPPDWVSQIFLAIPMVGLYLLGVGVAWIFDRRRSEARNESRVTQP